MTARRCRPGLVLACSLASTAAVAQTTGGVEGRVVDAATDAPVAGAVVAVTSPALQREQTAVTDARGDFAILLLPAGSYELRVTHDAYAPFAQKGVAVRLGRTLHLKAFVIPAEMAAMEVQILAERPLLALDAQAGAVIPREQMALIPYGRDARTFEQAAASVPGVQADLYGLQFRGSTSPETSVLIDGVNVSDVNFGMQGTSLPQDFVEQVEVKSGGFRAEYGRSMGGVINAVTKSGGDQVHGSVFVHGAPFEAARTKVASTGEAIAVAQAQRSFDAGVELGGPILPGRLWFFAGLAPQLVSTSIDRIVQARQDDGTGRPLVGTDGVPVTTEAGRTSYSRTATTWNFAGKLTWQPAEEHRLSLSVYGNPTASRGPNDLQNFGNPLLQTVSSPRLRGNESTFLFDTSANTTDVSLIYSGKLLGKSMLLEASAGFHALSRSVSFPAVGGVSGDVLSATPHVTWAQTLNLLDPQLQDATTPAAQRDLAACRVHANGFDPCPVSEYGTGGVGGVVPSEQSTRLSLSLKATHFLGGLAGRHVLRVGADVFFDRLERSAPTVTGGLDAVALPDQFQGTWVAGMDVAANALLWDPARPGHLAGETARQFVRGTSLSAFLQDTWSPLDSLAVDLGLRVERQLIFADRATLGADGAPLDGAQVALTNLMPRAGVSWDFTRRGLARAYASFGRFYESIPLSLASMVSAWSPAGDVGWARFSRQGCAASQGLLPLDPRRCPMIPDSAIVLIPARSSMTRIDPALGGQYLDEWQTGVELQALRDVVVALEYAHRAVGRVVEDAGPYGPTDGRFYLTNPGVAGTLGQATLPDGSFAMPALERTYDAITLSARKALRDGWLLGASYTFSSLRGNYAGLFVSENRGQLGNATSAADYPQVLANANGPLPGDSRHAFKLDGAWVAALDAKTSLQLGAAIRAQEGGPTNYLGAIFGYPVIFILPRGSGGRLPWLTQVDARAALARDLGAGTSVEVSLEAFNLLNTQTVTATNEVWTLSDVSAIPGGTPASLGSLKDTSGAPVAANPRWGQPTAYQLPLSLRLGARLTF